MNFYLVKLTEYYNKWKIRINTEKSIYTIIKPPKHHLALTTNRQLGDANSNELISINQTYIKYSNTIKYLGVNFNDELCNTHIILHKLNMSKMKFKKILFSKNVDPKIKLLIYKQILRPVISYCFSTWYNINSITMETIRKEERKILYCIYHPREYYNLNLYEKCDIERIDYHLSNLTKKHFIRTSNHRNPLIEKKYNIDNIENEICMGSRYKSPLILKNLIAKNLIHFNEQLLLYHIRILLNPKRNNIAESIQDIIQKRNTPVYKLTH